MPDRSRDWFDQATRDLDHAMAAGTVRKRGDCALGVDTASLPVPVDVLIDMKNELAALPRREVRCAATLRRETTWVWRRGDFSGPAD
ncbi:MAG TPA: hypothetical protein VL354_03600 [Spirochaetia bacterium]|nr:hypothetical protein [Spirochaetia bacterium]